MPSWHRSATRPLRSPRPDADRRSAGLQSVRPAGVWYVARAVRRALPLLRVTLVALACAGLVATAAAGAAPARPAIALSAVNVNGTLDAVISGATWRVSGVVSRFRRHQFVSLHVFDDGQRVMTRRVAIARRGREGVFSASLRFTGVGHITVHAIHFASRAMRAVISNFVSVWVVSPDIQPYQSGLAVRILQRQLSALHYVVGAPGVFDDRTQRAVLAFRKMANLPRTMVADATVFGALAAGEGAFPVMYPQDGRHVEADLTHQVLALINAGGQVYALYPMSSGKPSTPTAPGRFRVYLKTPGVNDVGMVDSNYFNGGDAIHGYPEVPPYNASHGCLRVPIPDAPTIYAWVQLGTPVDVYFRS